MWIKLKYKQKYISREQQYFDSWLKLNIEKSYNFKWQRNIKESEFLYSSLFWIKMDDDEQYEFYLICG